MTRYYQIWVFLVAFHEVTSQNYVTYHPGSLPIIMSAPHGGSLTPSQIPDRDAGCWDSETSSCIWSHDCGSKDENRCSATTVKDLNTKELTLELRDALFDIYGEYPHAIINELHRRKLDANRPIDEAAFGVAEAEQAWTEFQTYINQSKAASSQPSFYIDVHGHGHTLQWAELGYLISGSRLDSGDFVAEDSSILRLSRNVPITFEELLRGDNSFGGLLEVEGFESVPSVTKPGPDGNSYFSGGYNTQVHGSKFGGNTDGLQIESPSSFRADEMRPQYVQALARTIQQYMEIHFGFTGERSKPYKEPRMYSGAPQHHSSYIFTLLSLLVFTFLFV